MLIPLSVLFFLSFANGANDVSKAVATLAGARVTSVKKAVIWGTVWTAIGTMSGTVLGAELIKNMMSSLYQVPAASDNITLPLTVALTAAFWVLLATYRGWPVSTTHAIVGGLIGSGIVALGVENISWSVAAQKILLPLLISPLIAISLAWFFGPALQKAAKRAHGFKICLPEFPRPAFAMLSRSSQKKLPAIAAATGLTISIDNLHWLTSGLLSFSRGLNDAPKLIAITLPFIAMNNAYMQTSMFILCTTAMALGGLMGGKRITEVLGFKVTKMDHEQGFSANIIAALLVIGASRLGLPVSTTHVSASAIMGTGLAAKEGINGQVVTSIISAWLVTVPLTVFASAIIYLAIKS